MHHADLLTLDGALALPVNIHRFDPHQQAEVAGAMVAANSVRSVSKARNHRGRQVFEGGDLTGVRAAF